jgi:hypothetical protein
MTNFVSNAGYALPVAVNLAEVQGIAKLDLFSRVRKETTVSPLVTWNAITGEGVTGWVNNSVDSGASAGPESSTAQLIIGAQRLEQVFTVDKNELKTAAAYGGQNLQDLLAVQVRIAAGAILRKLEDAMINGGGGIVGLKQLFAASTGGKSTVAYAGISPTSTPKWTNLHLTAGANRAFTKGLIDGADVEIRTGGIIGNASDYDMVLTSAATALAYRSLYTAIQMPTVGGNVYDVGARFAAFNGRPVCESRYVAQADGIYFVDTEQLSLQLFAAASTPGTETMTFGSESATDLIGFELFKLTSNNPTRQSFALSIQPQFKIENRIAVACLDKLTP